MPLVVHMDGMQWVPRPDPMVGEWEALAGFVGGCLGGTALLAFVVRMNRRATAAGEALANAAAQRMGLPEANTTVPDTAKMSPEEFADFIGGLGEREKELFAGYQKRAAARAKSNRD